MKTPKQIPSDSLFLAFLTKLKCGEKLGESARKHYAFSKEQLAQLRAAANGGSPFVGVTPQRVSFSISRRQHRGRIEDPHPWLGEPRQRKTTNIGQPFWGQPDW
jgi:hypothetical protein